MSNKRFADSLSWGIGILLVSAVLWLYWPVLVNLIDFLYKEEDYSYGLLLPVVSAYLVYLIWPRLRHVPCSPTWVGLAVIFLGLSMYFVGTLGTGNFLVRFSFLVLITGSLLLICGWEFIREIKFPLFLLALAIPPPNIFITKISLPLQLISSRLAAKFLQYLGYVVNRQGNIIDIGFTQLQVVAACSGLRYILPLLSLGFIFCYLYQHRVWKIAVLLTALIPTAIICNALRVAGMGLFPELQTGFWHSFSGWLIFVVSLGLLFFLNKLLNLIETPKPASQAIQPPQMRGNNQTLKPKPPLAKYLTAALVLVLFGVGVIRLSFVISPIPLRQSFNLFPSQLGPWDGKHVAVDPEMVKATWSDAHLNMIYRTSEEKQVSLWIAYYEKDERGGAFKHTPQYCMTGSGWKTLKKGVTEIAPGYPVDYMVMGSLGNRVLVFYWQLWHGMWVTEDEITKPYLIWDSLYRRRTDGALVRLITPGSGDLKEAQELLTGFARLLLPVLPEFISYNKPENYKDCLSERQW